ncbi:MAG: HAMP domain-containing sensor histidine kinase [Pseudomonadota bacterium]
MTDHDIALQQINVSLRRVMLVHEIAFLLLVMVTGGLAGAWAYYWQQSSQETIRLNALARTAQEIQSDQFRQLQEVALAGLRDDNSAPEVLRRYSRIIRENLNELRRRSINRAEDYSVQELQEAFSKLQLSLRQILDDPFALNRLLRSKMLDPNFEQEFVREFDASFGRFMDLLRKQLAEQEQSTQRWLSLAPWAFPIPVLFAVLLLMFSRRRLRTDFVRPMHRVLAGVAQMREGELDHRIDAAGVTEISELADGINDMALELSSSRDALLDQERQSALGALVPVVAHNIRNPLAAIRANAQLLEGNETVDEVQETRDAIIQTVDRLGRWVNALVAYLHPLKPSFCERTLSTIVDDVIALTASRADESGIVIARGDWDDSLLVRVDPDLMEQAIDALLANAIDASRPEQVVTVSVAREAGKASLTIRDQAGGLPFVPKPTELSPGPSTKRFGTGLGLPIAFKICKAHNWSLDFLIREHEGTDAVLLAPLVEPI